MMHGSIDVERGRQRLYEKGMPLRFRSLPQIVRSAAFLLLAAMLLVRLGPLCETKAMAAAPAMSSAMDCASPSGEAPAKKAPPPACATPCAAVPGESACEAEPLPFAKLAPWAVTQTGLLGLSRAPATPPPQIG